MEDLSPLYKYTDSKYIDDFMSEGILRVGTLYDYRRTELGAAIGDVMEGKKTVFAHNPKGLLIVDSDAGQHSNQKYADDLGLPVTAFEGSRSIPIPNFMDESIIREGTNPGRVQIIVDGGGPISGEYEDKDSYIFSCSATFDRNAMLEFGYDSCIIIHDVDEFFKRVSIKLRKLGRFKIADNCFYTNRVIEHDSDEASVSASLIKDKEYNYQREVRAIWDAYHSKIKPILLKVGTLEDICSVKSNPLIGSHEDSFIEKEFEDLITEYFGSEATASGLSLRTTLQSTWHPSEGYRSFDLLWDCELVISCRYGHEKYNGGVVVCQSLKKDSGWLQKYHRRKTASITT